MVRCVRVLTLEPVTSGGIRQLPHIWQTVIFTPLSASFSTSLHAFAVIFRVLYQVEFGVQPTLSLLAATSSYGKATVCWVCTVCTISYFSYELRRNSKNCLRFLAEHELSFNLMCSKLKTDKNCPNAHVITSCGEPCERLQH